MYQKFYALILGFILLFVTNVLVLASDSITNGLHTARIIVPKAIVFSDENMNNPIGYLVNDKLITLGNPRKKNPNLVPLMVNGKIAFIELNNIRYESESLEQLNLKRGAPKEHNVDLILNAPEERLSENNSVYFTFQQFSGGAETKKLFKTLDGETKDSYTGATLSFLHRKEASKFFWGAGYEYNYIGGNNVNFKLYMIDLIAGYTIIKNPLFLFDLALSLDFSLAAQLQILNSSTSKTPGFFYGEKLNSRILFFPNLKYHPFGEFGLRQYKVKNLETVIDNNMNPIEGISHISGINLGIGISMEL